jgi:hypothetical protein
VKYKDLYPNMEKIYEEKDGTIRGSEEKPCHWCKQSTEYVDINYEAPFCSQECVYNFEKSCGL